MNVVELTEEERQAFREATAIVRERFLEEAGDLGKQALEAIGRARLGEVASGAFPLAIIMAATAVLMRFRQDRVRHLPTNLRPAALAVVRPVQPA